MNSPLRSAPLRGEIWLVQLDPVRGHEQAKTRPCIVISNNEFNRSLAELFIIIPLTSKSKNFSLHIKMLPYESGLTTESFAMPEHIRAASSQRFIKPVGCTSYDILVKIEEKIKILLKFA